MNEQNTLNFSQEDVNTQGSTNFFQIDFLKALMILLVIFDHFVSWNIKNQIGVALWERISIPVFLILLGFNMGYSFRKQGDVSLKELYSKNYFKKKILRFIIPFLILYAFSTFIGLFMYGFNFELMYNTQYSPEHGLINLFYFILPFWGPGNWFIPLLFQSILILPLLYYGFKKRPVLTLILTFVVEILMQLIVFVVIGEITTWEELYLLSMFNESVLFYLSAIGLGMWFSFGHGISDRRNRFMWVLFPLSLIYIIAYQFFDFQIRINDVPLLRGDYHFLVIPYSAFLILFTLKYLSNSSNSKISKGISLIGKSTYHILLIQILGYGMITAWWGTHYGIDVPFNPFDLIDLVVLEIIFVLFGILWYKIDKIKNLTRRTFYYLNLFIVFSSLLFLTFWAQGFWIPLNLLIIILYAGGFLILYAFIKKRIDTKILGIWTGFLVLNFTLIIFQVRMSLVSESWIFFILSQNIIKIN
ncbi:MAG: acyltransferase [Candidatus Lokiarchaeota archaeon]